MLLLGLILIVLGALVIVAAIFTVDIVGGDIELLGVEVTPLGLFIIGVAAGAAVLWGFAIFKWGTKRGLARRREQKKLGELSEKLDRADAERRHDIDDHADEDRPRL
jgi:flagellar motor component MotA